LIADENLGEPGASRMRNPKIASVLRDLNYAETKGTGIRTMRKMMQQANLTTPIITSDRRLNIFKLSLLSIHFIEEEDAKWLENFKDCNLADEEARALLFVRKFNYIDNAAFRAINSGTDTLKASGHLRKLRDVNLLEQRPQGSATYYIAGSRLVETLEDNQTQRSLFPLETQPTDKTINLVDKTIPLVGKTTNLVDKNLSIELKQSKPELSLEIEKVGKRATNEEIKILILKLCAWKTLKAIEIALLLGRTSHHVKTDYLSRMIRDELLEYKFPENPSHNQQAYRTTDKGKLELE
jgi:ATP-dependent DNA helicase RecG